MSYTLYFLFSEYSKSLGAKTKGPLPQDKRKYIKNQPPMYIN